MTTGTMKTAVLMLATLTALASCASISREDCMAGDWQAIGLRDGTAGVRPDIQFDRHQRQCAKVDVTPDRTEWQRGYDLGLQRFCTPLSGLEQGQRGRINHNLCPAGLAAGFDEGHALGLREHAQKMRVQNVLNEISSLQDRNRAALAGPAAGGDDGMRADLHNTRSDILHLRLELGLEGAALRRLEREVAAFRARVGG